MNTLIPKVMGWLLIIVTLALAPSINTANTTIMSTWNASTNADTMLGYVVTSFGAPLIVISLLFAGGMLGLGKVAESSTKDLMQMIGGVVITILALNLFDSAIGYVDALITASSGFAQTVYGIIPIVLYVSIIAGAGTYTAYKMAKSTWGKGKGKGIAAKHKAY